MKLLFLFFNSRHRKWSILLARIRPNILKNNIKFKSFWEEVIKNNFEVFFSLLTVPKRFGKASVLETRFGETSGLEKHNIRTWLIDYNKPQIYFKWQVVRFVVSYKLFLLLFCCSCKLFHYLIGRSSKLYKKLWPDVSQALKWE